MGHKRATNIITPCFFVGDFVVVCKAKKPAHKLAFMWSRPRKVIAVKSTSVCVVKNHLTQKPDAVLMSRLKKCCGMIDGAPVPGEVLDLADCTAAMYEIVEKIVNIAEIADGLWLRVQWRAFQTNVISHDFRQTQCTRIFPMWSWIFCEDVKRKNMHPPLPTILT